MQQKHLLQLAAISAILTATVLIVAKFIAWTQTGSLSLQASLIDSLLDIVASIINFFVIRQALKPADEEHRFGHGKAEALGGLAQTAFIAGSAIWLFIEAANHLIRPQPLGDIAIGNSIMVLAIVLTTALIILQRYVIKRTNSLAIAADSLHYQTDLLSCVAILAGLNITSYFEVVWLDSLIGIAIGIYILATSYRIGVRALNILMDHELSDDLRQKVLDIARANPYVKGVHDLRTRSSGNKIFIQLHVEMDKDLSLQTAHDEGLKISVNIHYALPEADVMIHHDPI
ncbi:cation diffusion facilitator family transporter [Candidatus Paracaedibacter symbiosus]|uniref:cation diffusion facilitator family transporter n=1 Tax=Candidatus Paracaedibacter symbiosus TaxID=244582 RepID=UPI0005093AAD|nr:cation diffusion facilitator family transporter [Candidatus Paracaedibacter symbiosus]